jgi:hypothetical protein
MQHLLKYLDDHDSQIMTKIIIGQTLLIYLLKI